MAGSPLIALTGKDDNANDNGKASGTGADTDVDEEDPDFADWDETSKSNTNQTHTTNQTQLQTSTPLPSNRSRSSPNTTADDTPQSPPEPNFFDSLGMQVTSSSVQVTRVAPKRPLGALSNGHASDMSSLTNAGTSRFSEDALLEGEEAPLQAGWGDDDLEVNIALNGDEQQQQQEQ